MRKPGASAAASGGDMERLSSQSFLTGEQRAALDAALAQKQASQGERVCGMVFGRLLPDGAGPGAGRAVRFHQVCLGGFSCIESAL